MGSGTGVRRRKRQARAKPSSPLDTPPPTGAGGGSASDVGTPGPDSGDSAKVPPPQRPGMPRDPDSDEDSATESPAHADSEAFPFKRFVGAADADGGGEDPEEIAKRIKKFAREQHAKQYTNMDLCRAYLAVALLSYFFVTSMLTVTLGRQSWAARYSFQGLMWQAYRYVGAHIPDGAPFPATDGPAPIYERVFEYADADGTQ